MNKRSPSSIAVILALAAVALLATACPDTAVPASLKDCTVTFETDGGSAVAAVIVKEGSVVAEPAAPTKAGHAFVGWYADAALSDVWDFATDVVSADLRLYAKWAAVHAITYVLNDGENSGDNPGSFVAGQALTLAAPTRFCRVFDGWYESSDFSGTALLSIPATAASDKTLYAKWKWAEYSLKDRGPAGGYIFYKRTSAIAGDPNSADSWMYLEAGIADLSPAVWSNITNASAAVTTYSNDTVGSGKPNTAKILAQSGHTNSAAKSCDDYSVVSGGVVYDDWFLPSAKEFSEACANLKTDSDPVGDLKNSNYWTSTENPGNEATQAMSYSVSSLYSFGEWKSSGSTNIRPVRRF